VFRPHHWLKLGTERCKLATGSALVGLLVLLIAAAPRADARMPVEPSGAPCPTTGALVVYYVSEGVAYKNNLVIGSDGRALLCWGRAKPGAVSGRTTFTVAEPTLQVLKTALDGIGVEHLGPPPAGWPPCCFKRATVLVYKGMGIPFHGLPTSITGKESLHRAKAILERIIERHDPDL
jgi:hypothetical protein